MTPLVVLSGGSTVPGYERQVARSFARACFASQAASASGDDQTARDLDDYRFLLLGELAWLERLRRPTKPRCR